MNRFYALSKRQFNEDGFQREQKCTGDGQAETQSKLTIGFALAGLVHQVLRYQIVRQDSEFTGAMLSLEAPVGQAVPDTTELIGRPRQAQPDLLKRDHAFRATRR